MHLCRSWIALGLFAVLAAPLAVTAAVVYKWTDADGVVHFSDQPVPGAEKIITSSGSSRGLSMGPSPGSSSTGTGQPPPPSVGLDFKEFAIVSPGHDETITGDQPVNVHLALDPPLKPGQIITWYLNGSPLTDQPPDATQFSLTDLARGSYSVSASIVDQASGDTRAADAVTFYVVRTNLNSPLRKAPP